jgi:hypothetical protein
LAEIREDLLVLGMIKAKGSKAKVERSNAKKKKYLLLSSPISTF